MVDISNVVNIVVTAAEPGLGDYNVNAFLYLASESPLTSWTTAYRVYRNAQDVATDFGSSAKVTKNAEAMFSQNYNFLSGGGYLIVAPLIEVEETPETLSEALTRVSALVYFGGWATDREIDETEVIAAANKTETMDCIYFLESHDATDMASGGLFETIAELNLDHTKLLYHGDSSDLSFLSAYASRNMSVNFSVQNSTITANLKTLKGIKADSTVDQTLYNTMKTLGVDGYVAYGGVAKTVSNPNGNGNYFDDVFNRLWFKQAMKVAIFNALATTNSKIPQTEEGMDYLKKNARQVCQLAVYNRFLAPGTWNGEYLFGNPEDFARNIEDFGYFIYSMPISQQSQTERLQRKAPVIQIAGKQAGAIHSASIIVTFEA
jgi:hypothetical protein